MLQSWILVNSTTTEDREDAQICDQPVTLTYFEDSLTYSVVSLSRQCHSMTFCLVVQVLYRCIHNNIVVR